MSPFREPPPVELGPLDVGLEDAARETRLRIPRGGRLIAPRAAGLALHTAGALGSAGFLGIAVTAVIGCLVGWSPRTLVDVAVCVGGVLFGGASLATVLRAIDRHRGMSTESGQVVGRAASRAVERLERLAVRARNAPASFGPRRVAALRRALHAARSPEIARWIDVDLRGRAELLLARALAADAGPKWINDPPKRAEIARLLGQAIDHLANPRAAEADLSAIKRRVAVPTGTCEDEAFVDIAALRSTALR